MLTHKIRKFTVLENTLQRAAIPAAHHGTLRLAHTNPGFLGPMEWTKAHFTEFIEKVKKEFAVGDLVTGQHCPVLAMRPPAVYYEVRYISELYHDTKFDNAIKEPQCLTLIERSLLSSEGGLFTRCPATLRKLTKEEIALVDLQNTKAKGNA